MTRPILLAVLALLFALPAFAQNTVTFRFEASGAPAPTGQTALIYQEGSDAQPLTRTIDADGQVVIQDLAAGTYFGYVAPNPDFANWFAVPVSPQAADSSYQATTLVLPYDPALGWVQGQITLADTGEPVPNILFNVSTGTEEYSRPVAVDGDGRYAFQIAPGDTDAELQLYRAVSGNGELYASLDVSFSVGAGERITLDLTTTVRRPGSISGTVLDDATGVPPDSVFVEAYATNGIGYGLALADADGQYMITVPEGPEYVVVARGRVASGYAATEFYQDALFQTDATLVPVVGDQTTTGIDFGLSAPGSDFAATVLGTVRATDGTPLDGQVELSVRGRSITETVPVTDGAFSFTSADPNYVGGFLRLQFSAPGYQTEFFDDSPTAQGAQLLPVGTEAVTFDLGEIVLLADGEQDASGLAISGIVTSESTGAPLGGAVIAAQRLDAPGVRYAVADAAGVYRIGGLAAGSYAVLFTEADHVPEFYPDAAGWAEAERIVLTQDRGAVNGLMGGLNRPVGANRTGAPFVTADVLSGAVRASGGGPLAGAIVTAAGANGTEAYAIADGAGQFSLDVVSPTVTVTADRGRYDTQTRTMSVGAQTLITLVASIPVAGENTPSAPPALHVFPNPTRGSVTVAFAAGAEAHVSVYDVLGREVLTATAASGADRVVLDTARLAPGRYVVRMLTGDRAETQPLTIVR